MARRAKGGVAIRPRPAAPEPSGAGPDLSHIAEALRPLAVPVADLVADPANARRHPEKNLEGIRASLRVYGQRKPVVVNRRNGVVEAGNGTLEAARALGWTHLAAVYVDDDPATAAGFAISDNRTAELAEWDADALGTLLAQVQTEDPALQAMLQGLKDAECPAAEDQPVADESGQLTEKFQVLIDCATEQQQAELLERLTAEGLTCRSLIS